MKRVLMFIAGVGILLGVFYAMKVRNEVNEVRELGRSALMASMHQTLSIALEEYRGDHGVYPPDREAPSLGSSETLYLYLSGRDVESPNPVLRQQLKRLRAGTKVYYNFTREKVSDYDGDGYFEAIDPYGRPWVYVRDVPPGQPHIYVFGE